MPAIEKVPKGLRAFKFHGIALDYEEGKEQASGDCPLCGRGERFFVNCENGLWDCKKCGQSGNLLTFLRLYYETLTQNHLGELAKERSLISAETLKAWGVRWSYLKGSFVVPGYSASGKLSQLYCYVSVNGNGKRLLIPTPGLEHWIHLPMPWDSAKPTVYVDEGPWDGTAVWEVLRAAKMNGSGLIYTSSIEHSLAFQANVLAVPGCGSVGEPFRKWLPLFAGKDVIWLGDSDHPKILQPSGKYVEPAALGAAKRAAAIFASCEAPPSSFSYLHWGDGGYDPSKPSGFDVRDELKESNDLRERVEIFSGILDRVRPIPDDWVKGRSSHSVRVGKLGMETTDCVKWSDLIQQWRKAMRWTEGLDRALSVMLSCIVSTRAVGDQLWVKVLGPPSCGKSTLCEALTVAGDYVLAKSTIRGFHSGYKTDAAGDEDHSLLALLHNKTLVTKDGDTLLQAPNLAQILSEARDIYDRVSRTHYRHAISRDYEGVNMTWILCGTSALRAIDSSELGARFLDCVVMEGIDDDLEDEILWRIANRVDRTLSLESGADSTSQHDPEMVGAMQMTGGYISYLVDNFQALTLAVKTSDEALRYCVRIGKFVAYLRARPSRVQSESDEREFAARVTSQHIRLARFMAVVLNRTTVDNEVLRRVRAVGLDTARGVTLKIVERLFRETGGLSLEVIAVVAGLKPDDTRRLLRFLFRIGAVEHFVDSRTKGIGGKIKWRLTPKMANLYRDVVVSYDLKFK